MSSDAGERSWCWDHCDAWGGSIFNKFLEKICNKKLHEEENVPWVASIRVPVCDKEDCLVGCLSREPEHVLRLQYNTIDTQGSPQISVRDFCTNPFGNKSNPFLPALLQRDRSIHMLYKEVAGARFSIKIKILFCMYCIIEMDGKFRTYKFVTIKPDSSKPTNS